VYQPLRLELFGGFRAAKVNGETVSFSSRKAQALLAYLAVEAGRAHPREKLASLLWADTGEERARHNLRQSLSKIRQTFGDIFVTDGDCLKVDPARCATDVGEFDGLSDAGSADALRRRLYLYRGEFLDGLEPREPEFADWLARVRARFRQAACETAAALADRLIDAGRSGEAIDALNDLLVVDPAHEEAHRTLIRLLAQAGRRSEALRQYQRCEEALARELGVAPDANTRALRDELQARPRLRREAKASSAAGVTLPTVAVLPFDNLSGEDAGYFSDGIAEDLITALSSFDSLAVISRGSSFAYRGDSTPDAAIAAELDAQFIVRGSVQRSANRVRISVQLMDTHSGLQVWAHRYDREMEDVFALQDEITSTLVSTLAGRVEATRLRHARKAAPERLDAYDLVLRGKDHHHRFTAEDTQICIDMFSRAIAHDPSFAIAHAWLACGYGLAMVFRLDDIAKLVDLSQAAAEKGLELDENESECHRVLAQVQLTRRDLDRSLWHQERALFLNPNDDRILCAQGEILTFVGHARDGEQWIRKALRLNPYHPERYWTHLARALLHQRRFDEVLATLDRVSRPRIDDRVYRVVAHAGLGDAESAKESARELKSCFPAFDVAGFVESLPYTKARYRQDIAGPLRTAVRALERAG